MGTTMLFLVPGDVGENYLKSLVRGRFRWGVLPTVTSTLLMPLIGWLWNGAREMRRSTKIAYMLASGAVLLFWLGLIIVADIRNG